MDELRAKRDFQWGNKMYFKGQPVKLPTDQEHINAYIARGLIEPVTESGTAPVIEAAPVIEGENKMLKRNTKRKS